MRIGQDIKLAKELVEHALRLNPNSASAWAFALGIESQLGNPARALEFLGRAERLSPRDSDKWKFCTRMAHAHFLDGQLDRALAFVQKGLIQKPRYAGGLRMLAVILVRLGRQAEARGVVQQML